MLTAPRSGLKAPGKQPHRAARSPERPTHAPGTALRTRVIDAARRLCFTRGVEGVSARKIAAEIGCSATAIYLHFDSIEHVLHEIRMEGHGVLVEYLRRPPESMHTVERLCAMQRQYHCFGVENPSYFRVMFLSRVDAAQLGRIVVSEGASLDVVRSAVAFGVQRGELCGDLDPVVVANVCWMSVHGLTSMVVSGHAAVTAPGLEIQLLDAVTNATRAWLGRNGNQTRTRR